MSKFLILLSGTVSPSMESSFPIAAKTLTDVLQQFGHTVDGAELYFDPDSHTVTSFNEVVNLNLTDSEFVDLLEKIGISATQAAREIDGIQSDRKPTPAPVYSQEAQEPTSDITEAAGRSSIAEDIAQG